MKGDHTLVAVALIEGVVRWAPFEGRPGEGELCMGGCRWSTDLDKWGVPELTANTRAEIHRLMQRARDARGA